MSRKKVKYTMHVRSVSNLMNLDSASKRFEAESENIGWDDSKYNNDNMAIMEAIETVKWFNKTINNPKQRPRELVSVSKDGTIIYTHTNETV